jgi:hypothetical protein
VTLITYDDDMVPLTSIALGARLIRISFTGLFVFSHPPLPFDSQISDLI